MSLMDGYKLQGPGMANNAPPIDVATVMRPKNLPFDFGTVVYHRVRMDKVKGLVTQYVFGRQAYKVGVTWGDNLELCYHDAFELTEEHVPDYCDEA